MADSINYGCSLHGGLYGSNPIVNFIFWIAMGVLIISGIYWFIKSANNKNNGGKK
jgi:hypothetical protein